MLIVAQGFSLHVRPSYPRLLADKRGAQHAVQSLVPIQREGATLIDRLPRIAPLVVVRGLRPRGRSRQPRG